MKERNGFQSLKRKIKRTLLDSAWLQIVTLPLLLFASGVKYLCLENTKKPKKIFACIMCLLLTLFNSATLYAEEAGIINIDPAVDQIVIHQDENITENGDANAGELNNGDSVEQPAEESLPEQESGEDATVEQEQEQTQGESQETNGEQSIEAGVNEGTPGESDEASNESTDTPDENEESTGENVKSEDAELTETESTVEEESESIVEEEPEEEEITEGKGEEELPDEDAEAVSNLLIECPEYVYDVYSTDETMNPVTVFITNCSEDTADEVYLIYEGQYLITAYLDEQIVEMTEITEIPEEIQSTMNEHQAETESVYRLSPIETGKTILLQLSLPEEPVSGQYSGQLYIMTPEGLAADINVIQVYHEELTEDNAEESEDTEQEESGETEETVESEESETNGNPSEETDNTESDDENVSDETTNEDIEETFEESMEETVEEPEEEIEPIKVKVVLPSTSIVVGDELPTITAEDISILFESIVDSEELENEIRDLIYSMEYVYNCDNSNIAGTFGIIPIDKIEAELYEIEFLSGQLLIQPKEADETFFTVSGEKSCLDENIFIGDITISPTGMDGFSQIVLEDGSSVDSIVISEEALNQEITFCFAKGEAVSTPVTYTYTYDRTAPQIVSIEQETKNNLQKLGEWFFGSDGIQYTVSITDNLTGVNYLHYKVGNDSYTIPIEDGKAIVTLNEEFEGRAFFYCMDRAGNVSEIISRYQVIEQVAPSVSFMSFDEDNFIWTSCDEKNFDNGNAYLRVYVTDEGDVKSGISEIHCVVNDEAYEPSPVIFNVAMLEDGSQVVTSEYFDLSLNIDGEYYITVTAIDHAGNQKETTLFYQVVDDSVLKVLVPTSVNLVVDPYNLNENGQIYSDAICIENLSDFDIEVDVQSVELVIDHSSTDGIEKTAAVAIEMTEDNVVIPITEGNNDRIYTFVVPTTSSNSQPEQKTVSMEYCLNANPEQKEENILEVNEEDTDDDKNKKKLNITGTVERGSENQWKDGDIHLTMVFNFTRAK